MGKGLEFVYLGFEGEIANIDMQIEELRDLGSKRGIDYSFGIRELEKRKTTVTRKIYRDLTGEQTVQVARHSDRPIFQDYLRHMITNFMELHGDRYGGGDDPAIVCGLGTIGRNKYMIIAHNKGKTTKEKIACRFGCSNPEGYRKAYRKMLFAEKYELPILTLVDTPGAYPGIGAEERGQAVAIAENLALMSKLKTPIVSVVIGEGGSGGALGIGVADRNAILEFAYYSVISPEGCAGILWKDGSKASEAAEALKLRSGDLNKLGLVDYVIKEPVGGAHRNPHDAIDGVKTYVNKTFEELRKIPLDELVASRYRKWRSVGNEFVIEKPKKKRKWFGMI